MKRGLFISFEGIEGSGKSTQARMLYEHLLAQGRKALLTKEPGGTAIGERIREILLCREHDAMAPVTELLLYAADRRQHVKEVVEPALLRGEVVVTDRYSDSTRAYQGHARGLDMALVDSLEEAATGGLKPDLTLLMDLDVREGLRRNRDAEKVDRLELEAVEFHERVREGFLEIQRAEPERVRLIDTSGPVGEVHARVVEAVAELLGSRGI